MKLNDALQKVDAFDIEKRNMTTNFEAILRDKHHDHGLEIEKLQRKIYELQNKPQISVQDREQITLLQGEIAQLRGGNNDLQRSLDEKQRNIEQLNSKITMKE